MDVKTYVERIKSLAKELNATPYISECSERLFHALVKNGDVPSVAFNKTSLFLYDLKDTKLEDIIEGNNAEKRKYSLIQRISFALLTLALAFGIAHWASAEEANKYAVVKNWEIMESTNGCFAISEYEKGYVFTIHINREGRSAIYIGNEKWNISEGVYPVELQIDNFGAWAAEANITDVTARVFAIGVPMKFIYELGKGKWLHIKAERFHEKFHLGDTMAALKTVAECIRGERSSPFGKPKPDDFPKGIPLDQLRDVDPNGPADVWSPKLDV